MIGLLDALARLIEAMVIILAVLAVIYDMSDKRTRRKNQIQKRKWEDLLEEQTKGKKENNDGKRN